MKKRLVTLMMALCLAFALVVPAGAASMEQTPEELYEEYIAVVEEINENYGVDLSVRPMEVFDRENMPTVETVWADATDFALRLQQARAQEQLEDMVRINKDSDSGISPLSDPTGYQSVSVNSAGYWGNAGFTWKVSASVHVNVKESGSRSVYYYDGILNPAVNTAQLPSGYSANALGNLQYTLSGTTTYTVWRNFEVYNGTTKCDSTFTPKANFNLNASTGKVTPIAVRAGNAS